MENRTEGENLKSLGANTTNYTFDGPSVDILETFENKFPEAPYEVEFNTKEFTSLCPKTGQPDFATIRIVYWPDKKCIETKSLKLYLFSFRNVGTFMETITNTIKRDLVEACSPLNLRVIGTFNQRGGIELICRSEYQK